MLGAGLALTLSVAMHVTWNLIARHQPAHSWPLWWVLLAHLLLLGPWGFWALATEVVWSMSFVLLLTTSALANLFYFLGLHQAYRRAPVALVYPLVRSSPLLIALWSTLLFERQLSTSVWLGICVSIAGLWLMAGTARGGDDRRALPWALLAMLCTSIYSLSDKAATPSLHSFASLIGFISVGYLLSWLGLTLTLRREQGRWMPAQRIDLRALLVGGFCIGLAYVLVVHAMRTLPSAVVVAYTNAGIVLACLASVFLFHEREHWRRRLLGALIISLGLLLM